MKVPRFFFKNCVLSINNLNNRDNNNNNNTNNVTVKSDFTEGIRTTIPLPAELIGKFPLAAASISTLYQHCYIFSPSSEVTSRSCEPRAVELFWVVTVIWYNCFLELTAHTVGSKGYINQSSLKEFEPRALSLSFQALYQPS